MSVETNNEGMPIYQAIATIDAATGNLKLTVMLDPEEMIATGVVIRGQEADLVVTRMRQFHHQGTA